MSDQLQPGDRVRLSEEGQRMFPKTPLRGTVRRVVTILPFVSVIPDGRKRSDLWHASYWEKTEDPT